MPHHRPIFAAAFAIVTAILIAAPAIQARAADEARANGGYLAFRGGVNDLQSSNIFGAGVDTEAKFDNGPVMGLAFGHAYGNGWRAEGEISRRRNDTDAVGGVGGAGDVTAYAFMLNGYYDFPTLGRVTPYVGLGLGYARIDSDVSPVGGSRIDGSDGAFAWQAIAGAALPLGATLDLTADVRLFSARNASLNLASGGSVESGYRDASFLVGLRWRFGAPAPKRAVETASAPLPPPAPVAESKPAPKPAPAAKAESKPRPKPAPKLKSAPPSPQLPRSFLIFFDWDKSDIRPDARKILEAVARLVKRGRFVRLHLTGHADRSGPAWYNKGLSFRRARATKAVLVKLGIAAAGISVAGKGETEPLVPTADGVREARNRRVEIVF